MNLRKLPPAMVLALGLMACGDDGSTDSGPADAETSACLSFDPSLTDSDATTGGTSSGSTGGSGDSGSSGSSSSGGTADVSTGPCLTPEPPTGTDSTGTDSGSESGSGSSGSGGMMSMDEPGLTQAEATRRVLDRGTLPPDVAERLRQRLDRE